MLNILLTGLSAGGIADIIVAVFLLIIALSCLIRGFVKQTFGLISTILALIISYLLCGKLVDLLNSIFGLQSKLAEQLALSFSENPAFSLEPTNEGITQAIQQLGLPDFVTNLAIKIIPESAGQYENVGLFLSDLLARYLLIPISFIILFIVLKLISLIFKNILLKLVQLPIARSLDKILGFILGLIKGIIWIISIIFILRIIPSSVPYMDVVKQAMDESALITFIENTNFSAFILNIINTLIA